MAPLNSRKIILASGAVASDSLDTPHHLLHSATRRARIPLSEGSVNPPNPVRFPEPSQFEQLFPKTLSRPQPTSHDFLTSVYQYEGTMSPAPLEYIRKGLVTHGPQFLAAYKGYRVDPPLPALPSEMEFTLSDSALALAPTHLLAAYEPAPDGTGSPSARVAQNLAQRRETRLFPVHAIVFLAFCARAPAFARTEAAVRPLREQRWLLGQATNVVRLPVVPFVVPNLATFELLERFLYSQDLAWLHAQLVDVPEPRAHAAMTREQRVREYARHVARTAGLDRIGQMMQRTLGFWKNAVGLGMDNDAMWAMLESDWVVLMQAVQLLAHTGSF